MQTVAHHSLKGQRSHALCMESFRVWPGAAHSLYTCPHRVPRWMGRVRQGQRDDGLPSLKNCPPAFVFLASSVTASYSTGIVLPVGRTEGLTAGLCHVVVVTSLGAAGLKRAPHERLPTWQEKPITHKSRTPAAGTEPSVRHRGVHRRHPGRRQQGPEEGVGGISGKNPVPMKSS